jgi:hypothetical protein
MTGTSTRSLRRRKQVADEIDHRYRYATATVFSERPLR